MTSSVKGVYQVVAIDRPSKLDRIKNIFLLDGLGDTIEIPLDVAISKSESGVLKLYISDGKNMVDVVVVKETNGRKYLKTINGDYYSDNLLSLDNLPSKIEYELGEIYEDIDMNDYTDSDLP